MAAARRGEISLDSKSVRWLAVGIALSIGLLLVAACSAGAAQSRAAAPSVTTGAAVAVHGTVASAASASSPPSTAGAGASNEGSGGSRIENQPTTSPASAHVATSQIANQSSLAFTGSRNETMTIAGLVLVASGVSLVLAARRRCA
jgi:hypothetical protein